jgi:hypothetical protein
LAGAGVLVPPVAVAVGFPLELEPDPLAVELVEVVPDLP